MRPLELTINAFGPFNKKVSLDFTQFEQQNTFLVSGPTGSGKTTIFDAISYALYGEGSGEMREVEGFKSTHATDKDLCYVNFKFEVRGKVYTIHRAPTQRAPGKTGKPINYQTTVSMEYGKDKVLSKVAEVEEKVISLLGMNVQQFHQIVLLPQGEFRKMLDSSSKEKTEIFRDIFKTHPLENFQEKLREEKKEIEKNYQGNQKLLEQIMNRIDAEAHEDLKEALSKQDFSEIEKELERALAKDHKKKKEKEETLQVLTTDEKEHENYIRDLKERARLKEEMKVLEQKEEGIKTQDEALSRHTMAQALQEEEKRYQEILTSEQESRTRLVQNKEDLTEVIKEMELSQATYQKIQEEHEKLPDYREEMSKTEEELRNKKKLEKDEEERDQLLEDNRKQVKFIKELDEKIKNNEKEEQELLNQENKLNNLKEEKQTKDKVYSEEEKRAQNLRERLEIFYAWEKGVKKHQIAVAEYQEKEERFEEEDKLYRHLFKQYQKNTAGILASNLQEDDACPVCGSYDHPKLAGLSDHDVNEEAVQLQEEKRKAAQQAFIELASSMEQKQKEIKTFSENLEVKENDRETEQERTQEDCEKAEETLASLQRERDELAEELAQKEEITSEKVINQNERAELKIQVAETSAVLKENEKRLNHLENEINDLEKQTGLTSKKKLEELLDKIKKKIKQIETNYKNEEKIWQKLVTTKVSLETAVQAGQEDVERQTALVSKRKNIWEKMLSKSSLESDYAKYLLDEDTVKIFEKDIAEYRTKKIINRNSLDEIEKVLKKRESVRSLEEYQEELEKIKEKKELFAEKKQNIAIRLTQYDSSLKELKEFSKRGQDLQEKYGRYEELSRLANGTSKETDYISFERYVLGIYFDDILRAANLRFKHMSNQRYQLRRKKEAGKGGGAKGLDIEVMDQQTGITRDVSTLSGGESFEASLSLAMGMSDVLQSQQGGVSVDTLFIDEGFGTLDSESLDNAIEVLMELNGEGRLIGIISHVEELKTRISSQIEVEKKREGSFARVVT